MAVGAAGVIFDPLGGWLSDRFGRRRVILLPWLMSAVLVFPWLLDDRALSHRARVVYRLRGARERSTLAGTTALVAITESLPRRVRAGGFGLIYATSIAVFGGSTQFMAAWLTRVFGGSAGAGVVHAGRARARVVALS